MQGYVKKTKKNWKKNNCPLKEQLWKAVEEQ